MNYIRHLIVFMSAAQVSAIAGAVDLSKIERTIEKEPAYRNNSPTYSLLVFGPSAKTRLWIVLDGTDLYVDKNCDGQLNAADERFENDGEDLAEFEVADKSGKDRYKVSSISVYRFEQDKKDIVMVSANVTVVGKFRQYDGTIPTARLQEAPVSHFGGPLSLDVNRDTDGNVTQRIALGDKDMDLNVMIGTFDRKNGCWVALENSERQTDEDFPADLHPLAEVQFAPKKAGAAPIRIQDPLKERC